MQFSPSKQQEEDSHEYLPQNFNFKENSAENQLFFKVAMKIEDVLLISLKLLLVFSLVLAVIFLSIPQPLTPIRNLQGTPHFWEEIQLDEDDDENFPRWYSKNNINPIKSQKTLSQPPPRSIELHAFGEQKRESISVINSMQVPRIAPPRPSLITNPVAQDPMGIGITLQQKHNAEQYMKLKSMDISTSNPIADEERAYYEDKYQISSYEELPICAVVPSYNNQKENRSLLNMASILQQQYSNYQIVFIDDASTDKTSELVAKMLQDTKFPPEKYTMIKNKEKLNAMQNLRRAAKQFCKPDSIFIVIDGDDELIGRQVFKLYNAVFQKRKIWFMYTNFLDAKRKTFGYSRPFPKTTITNNQYRSYPFVTSHLRAFYTQLFLKVNEQDLKNSKGEYYSAANDVAICTPILEMSHQRVAYIPELTYGYNSNTGLNNHILRLKLQKDNHQEIRLKQHYQPLQQLSYPHGKEN